MADIIAKGEVTIRGKIVKFVAKRLKDGTIALYRDGKRAWNSYQRRLARGILEGKSIAEATGRSTASFTKKWGTKFYGRKDINEKLARYSGTRSQDPGAGKYGTTGHEGDKGSEVPWAAPPNLADGALERHRYYALISVQVKSALEAGSDIAHDEGAECAPMTIVLLKNRGGRLDGITRAEFRNEFERLVPEALNRAGIRSCSQDWRHDIQGIWRHANR